MATSNTTFFGSIRGRLLFGTSALALIPLILLTLALGYYATRSSGEALNQRAYDQMQSIRTGKQAEVGAYFDNIRNLVRVVANTTEVRQALVEGARSRLRPIVMTTLCTLFGFLPLALATGDGAEVRAPMAITVIGGLLVSTLLTLFVIPVVYSVLDRRGDAYYLERGRRARAKAGAVDADGDDMDGVAVERA